MKLLTLIFTAFFFAALALPAAAAPRSTENFVKNATVGNMFEVQSSIIALEKSQNEAVKEFAGIMVEDHREAAQAMKKALADSGTDAVPPTGLDEKHRKLLDKMQSAEGAAFDKQYINAQVMAHNEAVDLFAQYSRNGEAGPLQAFAAGTLPTLKEHQEHVKELNTRRR